jgi:hypothetical protein
MSFSVKAFSVKTIPVFDRQYKRLAKRYPSLAEDLRSLRAELANAPTNGVALGKSIYKLRLAIGSEGRGKSGGARVITYCVNADHEVWLLSIYDKSELDSVNDGTLAQLVEVAELLRLSGVGTNKS